MKGWSGVLICIVAIWIAGILQVSLAPRLAIGLGAPDFGLIVLGTLCLFCDRKGSTLLGFGVGWMHGSLLGLNLTLFILSRTLAGFLLGWALGLGVQRNFTVAAIACLGATLMADYLMLFLGVRHGPLLPYLAGTLVTSMYDGVIAALLFLVVGKVANPRRQDRF